MIISDIKNHNGLKMEGSISEVTAECILIMREIYKRNKEVYNQEIAAGILTNMAVKAIYEQAKYNNINWETSDEEKLSYTE